MPSSLGTPGECLHKFVFRTLHFVVRPEKPASEELCYRLISHIDPAGFLCCWTSCCCCSHHVCVLRCTAQHLRSITQWTTLRRRLRVSPVCSSGLDRPRTCTSLCCTAPYTFFTVSLRSRSVALRSVSVFLHRSFCCVTLACCASRMFANSMIFIGSRPQTRWRCVDP